MTPVKWAVAVLERAVDQQFGERCSLRVGPLLTDRLGTPQPSRIAADMSKHGRRPKRKNLNARTSSVHIRHLGD
jgi:hypothetical protein